MWCNENSGPDIELQQPTSLCSRYEVVLADPVIRKALGRECPLSVSTDRGHPPIIFLFLKGTTWQGIASSLPRKEYPEKWSMHDPLLTHESDFLPHACETHLTLTWIGGICCLQLAASDPLQSTPVPATRVV